MEIKAPNTFVLDHRQVVFLAGSIDMGAAEKWQDRVVEALRDEDIVILNPRRDDWDSSWVQDISNDNFREQVEWELDGLMEADTVIFYFSPGGPAPVTLLELGYVVGQTRVVVCCPPGYWRRGNVQVLCARHEIPMYDSLEELIDELKG